jgi:hypothetical protein
VHKGEHGVTAGREREEEKNNGMGRERASQIAIDARNEIGGISTIDSFRATNPGTRRKDATI